MSATALRLNQADVCLPSRRPDLTPSPPMSHLLSALPSTLHPTSAGSLARLASLDSLSPMLQVAAGATSVCGSTIGPRQFKDAQRRLRIWGKTEDAWTCLWQSARYLRQALFADWGIYTPWAVYMTVLVHWAYAWTLPNSPAILMPSSPNGSGIGLDSLSPSASTNQHQATLLLDHILISATRLDSLDQGMGELISCTAEKLGAMGDIEKEESNLLWRLLGTGAGHKRRSSNVWETLI